MLIDFDIERSPYEWFHFSVARRRGIGSERKARAAASVDNAIAATSAIIGASDPLPVAELIPAPSDRDIGDPGCCRLP
jgi:hypothetical protein